MRKVLSANVLITAALIILLSSCNRSRKTVTAMGDLSIAFPSEEDAAAVIAAGPITVTDGDTEFILAPRDNPLEPLREAHKRIVVVNIEIKGWKAMDLETEQDFIDLVAPSLDPAAVIYGISVPGLTHSDQDHDEFPDLESFWNHLIKERPHSGYSVAEIRALLPGAFRPAFEEQIASTGEDPVVVLDWEHDERVLLLKFRKDPDEENTLLRGITLDYLDRL